MFKVKNVTKIHTCVISNEILSTENKFNGIIFGWKASECQNQSPVVRLHVSQNFFYFFRSGKNLIILCGFHKTKIRKAVKFISLRFVE